MHLGIIGGGPAGLMAALTAGELGAQVTVWEAGTPGRKLLASGGGRCNLTNALEPVEFIARFGVPTSRFIRPAILEFPPAQLLAFMASHNLPCHAPDHWHYYPATERSRDVWDLLIQGGQNCGVALQENHPVTEIVAASGRITGVVTCGQYQKVDALLVATGGVGFPALGGSPVLFALLKKLGHQVVEPVPALCNWDAPEVAAMALPGLALDEAQLTLADGATATGELLFTHQGFSGPAALNLAGRLFRNLRIGRPEIVRVNFWGAVSREQVETEFKQWCQHSGRLGVENFLVARLPRRLAHFLVEHCQLSGRRGAEITVQQRQNLLTALTAFPVTVALRSPWRSAMCTSGGVALSEVRAKSLQSKLFENLFFAGEVLDVDGPCGGFNLQWAFSSGRLAGRKVVELEN